jgi:hypothetical protein
VLAELLDLRGVDIDALVRDGIVAEKRTRA